MPTYTIQYFVQHVEEHVSYTTVQQVELYTANTIW